VFQIGPSAGRRGQVLARGVLGGGARRVAILTAEDAARDTAQRERDRKVLIKALVAQKLLARPKQGTDPEAEVLEAWLRFLARSEARGMLVFLEDLWGEVHSQNIPGTRDEHPNWRWRIPHSLEAVRSMPEVVGRLRQVDNLRTGAETRGPRP